MPTLTITKQQIMASTDVAGSGYTGIPLTSAQWSLLDHCKQAKVDYTITMNFHQMQAMAKENFDMDFQFDISNIVGQLSKKHIRKI